MTCIILSLIVPFVLWAIIVASGHMPEVRCPTCNRRMIPFQKDGFIIVAGEGPGWACESCSNVYCADHLPEGARCECGKGEIRVCNVLYNKALKTPREVISQASELEEDTICRSCGEHVRSTSLLCEHCGKRTSVGIQFIQAQFCEIRRYKNWYLLLEFYAIAAILLSIRLWLSGHAYVSVCLILGSASILAITRNFWRSHRHIANELRSNGITPWLK